MGSWIDLVEGTASFDQLAKAGDLNTLSRVLDPTARALTGVIGTNVTAIVSKRKGRHGWKKTG